MLRMNRPAFHLFAICLGCCAATAEAQGSAAAIRLQLDPVAARQTTLALIRDNRDPLSHARYAQAEPIGTGLFASAERVIPPADREAELKENPDLAAWLREPAELQAQDLLVLSGEDAYSEEVSDAGFEGRTPYASNYILRFRAQAGGSRVELIALRPTVRLGKRLRLLGRAGPGMYWDIRPARPSQQARAKFRDWLLERYRAAGLALVPQ